jgi:NhaP-type Na+/H+ or K+/H+ antiporter
LPISIVFGALVGKRVFPEFSWLELAILSTVLAPTDAALGEPVVSNEKVPSEIREAINVESGLNDGICVPILILLLTIQKVSVNEQITWSYGASVFLQQIGIGLVVGVGIVSLSLFLIKKGYDERWIESAWRPTIIISLSIACFAMAQALGGSGFIAAFTGGIVLGKRFKKQKWEFLEGAEGVGKILSSTVWIVFGSVLTAIVIERLTAAIVFYALASLTFIRILPVLFSLLFHNLRPYDKFFTAWFGPRGLASIVFAAIVFEAHLQNGQLIVMTVCFTILLSVFAHGISAIPMTKVFERRKE